MDSTAISYSFYSPCSEYPDYALCNFNSFSLWVMEEFRKVHPYSTDTNLLYRWMMRHHFNIMQKRFSADMFFTACRDMDNRYRRCVSSLSKNVPGR